MLSCRAFCPAMRWRDALRSSNIPVGLSGVDLRRAGARSLRPELCGVSAPEALQDQDDWEVTNMSMRGLIAGSFGLAAVAMPVHAADTTADRLLNPDKEPGNWLMVHHDYNNSRHSDAQPGQPRTTSRTSSRSSSSRSAVARPAARCAARKNRPRWSRTASCTCPTPGTRVMKFDVRSGTAAIPLWRYDPKITQSRTNRGIAMYGDKVLVVDQRHAHHRAQEGLRRGRLGNQGRRRRPIRRPARRRRRRRASPALRSRSRPPAARSW